MTLRVGVLISVWDGTTYWTVTRNGGPSPTVSSIDRGTAIGIADAVDQIRRSGLVPDLQLPPGPGWREANGIATWSSTVEV